MESSSKKGTVSLLGAIAIGVGGMVGGGIFAILGEAVSLAHGATMLAFLLAGIVALFTAYSYAKLSVAFQNRGGTVIFINHGFGNNLLSGSINLLLWLSYLVTISLYATAFASYGMNFFPSEDQGTLLKHMLITIAIVLPSLINLISASFVSRSEFIIVVIKVLLLIVIIVAGASFVDPQRLTPTQWGSTPTIFAAGMIIFVAYEGFELIANTSEDIKNPEKNLPRALYLSVGFVIVLYILISMITVGSVSERTLMQAKDYALAIAAKPALGDVGFSLVTLAALLATFSAINATIYGNARLGYTLAKEGKLPSRLDREKHHIPVCGIITITLFSLIMANSIDLTQIAIIGSAGFLLIFTIVNLSAWKLSQRIDANLFVTITATGISLLALLVLLLHTYHQSPHALWIFLGFIGFSLLFEWLYGTYIRKHFLHNPYRS